MERILFDIGFICALIRSICDVIECIRIIPKILDSSICKGEAILLMLGKASINYICTITYIKKNISHLLRFFCVKVFYHNKVASSINTNSFILILRTVCRCVIKLYFMFTFISKLRENL